MMNIRQWTVLVLVAVVAAHAESALQDGKLQRVVKKLFSNTFARS